MQGGITPYPGYRVVNILGLLRNLFRLPRVLGSLLSTLGEDNQLLKAERTSMEYIRRLGPPRISYQNGNERSRYFTTGLPAPRMTRVG
jgi:hypothetical protein